MLYIIRHGQTEMNSAYALQGRSNHPLNDVGIQQAKEAGRWFKEQGITFSKIYTSPLIRAIQTAENIAVTAELIVEERLIEMDYGPYEGMSLKNPAPEVLEFFQDFANNPAPEGMEQLSSVVSRAGQFVEEILSECEASNILISTHAIAMKGILEYLTPESKGSYWSTNIGNCAIYSAEVVNQSYSIPVRRN